MIILHRCKGRDDTQKIQSKGAIGIDEKTKSKLKQILLSIASAEANEVISWGRDAVLSQGDKIKLSKNLSRAVSSIKMKATRDTLDLDLKLLDKLKAIELYFKLCDEGEGGEDDFPLSISYSYVSPEGDENG